MNVKKINEALLTLEEFLADNVYSEDEVDEVYENNVYVAFSNYIAELLIKFNYDSIVLSTTMNQYGEEIIESKIYICKDEKKGIYRFWESSINCYSSHSLGLGGCRCESHPAELVHELTCTQYLKTLFEYLKDQKEKEKTKLSKLKEELKKLLE